MAGRIVRVFLLGLAVLVGFSAAAGAGPIYWTGSQDGNWNSGAVNWSSSPISANPPAALPASTDNVYFTCNPASNLTTTLGQDFSIQGLTFTSNATSPVTIGGSNTLTIGGDGVSVQNGSAADLINAKLALGAAQTWTNLNSSGGSLSVYGGISGSAPLTLAGGGGFVWGGSNSLTSALTVSGNGTSLSIGGSAGQGSAQNVTSVTLAGGNLYLDSSGGSLATSRLATHCGRHAGRRPAPGQWFRRGRHRRNPGRRDAQFRRQQHRRQRRLRGLGHADAGRQQFPAPRAAR